MNDDEDQVAVHLPHHLQQELCTTRAIYRQGRKLTAVKVYTVNNESQHLLVYRVPAIKLLNELAVLCNKFGTVSRLNKLEQVDPGEEFTDVYYVCYSKIREARRAKRGLDGRSFYGSPLHVCYAPELESIEETRMKLINRRNEIAYHTGRKMKVPKLSLKRPGTTHDGHHRNKKLKLLPAEISLGVPGPSTSPASYSQPSTSSQISNERMKGPYPSTAVYQHPPIHYAPKFENGLGSTANCTTDVPALAGLSNVINAYPSQEVLRLPGREVKIAREKKFVPSSVAKRSTATPNRIIFHKNPADTS